MSETDNARDRLTIADAVGSVNTVLLVYVSQGRAIGSPRSIVVRAVLSFTLKSKTYFRKRLRKHSPKIYNIFMKYIL